MSDLDLDEWLERTGQLPEGAPAAGNVAQDLSDPESPPGIRPITSAQKAALVAPEKKAGPNLTPYGMEAPPLVERDRLGEVANLILGTLAGKDKHARRAAFAEGLGTMIARKPGEVVEKENYDRKLRAAQLAAQEARQNAPKPEDPYKKLYADTTAQRIQWEKDARDPASDVSRRTRELFYRTNPDAYPAGSLDQYTAADLSGFKQIAGMPAETAKQKGLIDYREGLKKEEEQRDYALWLKKHGIETATDKDLAQFRAELAATEKQAEKGRERAQRAAPPGVQILNENAWAPVQADETSYRKVVDSVDAYSALVESLEGMIALRAQHGAELPGHAQALYDSLKTNAVGAYTKLGESGTLNGGEWERYSSMMPSLAPDRLDALGAVQGKDLKLEQLKGVLEASRRVIDSRLRSKGVRFDPKAGSAPAPAAPKPRPRAKPAPAPNAAPVVKSAADLDDL